MMTLPFRPLEERRMAISLPDARELSDEVLEALRLRALRGCELGLTEAELADLFGVCRETVSRWWSAYAQGGADAPSRKSPGDGPWARAAPLPTSRRAASSGCCAHTTPRSW